MAKTKTKYSRYYLQMKIGDRWVDEGYSGTYGDRETVLGTFRRMEPDRFEHCVIKRTVITEEEEVS